MATDAVNITEDAEMAECDGDKVVTMMDVLQEQQEFEEDANAVLGASDDKNCTYAKGYIKRQALYACLTCCPDVKMDPTKRAGVCLACSLACHENHELVELYTKRNFRCDCGNPKFNSHPCQFTPYKPDLNGENIYNQNFSGLYCICKRPYPDPEASFEDDMIQCIICEDWLHALHLDAVVPSNDQYAEMICKGCMEKNEFLHDYSNLAVNIEPLDVDILTVNDNDSTEVNIYNGDVTKDTENEKSNNGSSEKDDESVTLKENIEQTEDAKDQSPDKISSDNTKNEMDLDKNELESSRANEDAENVIKSDAKEDKNCDNVNIEKASETLQEVQNKDTEINDQTENENETGNSSEVTKESSSETQDQKDEQSTKTEDQLLEDIKALTDNPPDEPKSSTIEEPPTGTSEKPEEESKENIESPEIDKSSETKGDESHTEQTNELLDSTETLQTSDSHNKVPDTSKKENLDDKTDAVMDAIDALLESTEAKDSEVNEESSTNKETSVRENKVTEKIDSQSNDGNNADAEMPDSKSQDDLSANENETAVDSEMKSSDVDAASTIESTISESIAESESVTDTNKELTITESHTEANGDITKETPTNAEDANTSNNDPSNDESKVSNAGEMVNENKRKLSIETQENSPKKAKLDNDKCIKPKNVRKVHKGATFWPSNFRQKLCTCGACITMYKDLHVLFLTDLDDTVSAYESLGKENIDGGASQYEKGLQALSSLDRIQQINALTEYNRMRDKLLDFLKSFKDRKEIVKEEDIKAFFAGMKPRQEPDGVYFCR